MTRKMTTEEFIARSIAVHKDKFCYDKTMYNGSAEKAELQCNICGIMFWQNPSSHLRGNGCLNCCNIEKTKTINDFVSQANILHNEKYDYSLIEGDRLSGGIKVPIRCKKCNLVFYQTPHSHLLPRGCPDCGVKSSLENSFARGFPGHNRMEFKNFVSYACKVHNGIYNYPDNTAFSYHNKIKIMCKEHGIFWQKPVYHLAGRGCIKCANKKISQLLMMKFEDFIEAAKMIHGNKFTYSSINFNGSHNNIIIKCNKHNEYFYQTPSNHLRSKKCCPRCSKRKQTKDDVIKIFIKTFGNIYNYSFLTKDTYIQIDKITIICNTHGNYIQSIYGHMNGFGCPQCLSVKIGKNSSKAEMDWLDSLNIPLEFRQKIVKAGNKYYKADAFVEKTKTIYEFYGDYYHGNPKKYAPDTLFCGGPKTMGSLYFNTIKRENHIKLAGYNLISIWENDFYAQQKKTKNEKVKSEK